MVTIPEAGPARSAFYRSAVFDTLMWCEIRSVHNGRTAVLRVTSDAPKIGDIRCAMSAREAQDFADRFGLFLPTSKINQIAWDQADVRIEALQRTWNYQEKDGTSTRRMIEQSAAIDRLVAAKSRALATGQAELVADVGKDWIIDPRVGIRAVNDGWRELSGVAYQTEDAAHGFDHTDYSQMQRFVRRDVTIDTIDYSYDHCLAASELWPFVADAMGIKPRLPLPAPKVGVAAPAGYVLVPGMTGEVVREWQFIVGVKPDSAATFGPLTTTATQTWQRKRGFAITGKVTAAELAQGRAERDSHVVTPDLSEHLEIIIPASFPEIAWVPTPNFYPGRRNKLTGICLHTAEIAEHTNSAENLAAWLAGPNRPRASWHLAVDCDSITRSVLDTDTAWHAGGANSHSIGIEMAARALQGSAGWADLYSRRMLGLAAMLVASLCREHGIPPVRLDVAGVKARAPGIFDHAQAVKAFGGNHGDVGPTFPWDAFMSAVAALAQP